MKPLRRIDQKEQTRKTLIQTSFAVFSDHGIASTNTAALAKYARVSHGTIFLHFPTRDDLIFAVMQEFADQLAAKFKAATQHSKGVAGILKAHLDVLYEYEGFYSHLVCDLPLLSDAIRSHFYLLQTGISHRIHLEVKKEMDAGKIRKMDRHLFFNTWLALLHYYFSNRQVFSPDQSVIETWGSELLQHFLKLIKK